MSENKGARKDEEVELNLGERGDDVFLGEGEGLGFASADGGGEAKGDG